uniref:UBX domain-containing protein n=1 Tax=Anopheles dirus TaxID=7168 RepID=A0A182NIF2_9DIPT
MFFDALTSLNITKVLADYLLVVSESVRRQFAPASSSPSSQAGSAPPPPAAGHGNAYEAGSERVGEASAAYELNLLTAGWCFLCETLQLAKVAFGSGSRWLDFTDFQLVLLQLFSSILIGLLVLIALSWRKYGNRITNRFIRPSTAKEIEELKLSKAEAKLKLGVAGPGRKLNSTAPPPPPSKAGSSKQKDVYVPPKRNELSAEAKAAANAALARFEGKDKKEFNTSLAAIRAQVRKELEAEKKAKEGDHQTVAEQEAAEQEAAEARKDYAVQGVFFRCPMIGDEVLPYKEWKGRIKEFLYEQLAADRGLTACLIIYNCNPKDKAEVCIETLAKCVENIVNNPNEEKYKKIRMSNRMFRDKIKVCEGSMEFLHAAGFAEIELDEEPHLIWSEDNIDPECSLEVLLEALKAAEPIPVELDRNLQVLLPSQVKRNNLPPDFFRISPEELKREQQLRTDALEQAQILKTKAMREKEELRTLNRYKFALIRVRFPNGVYLQGTFNVYEKLGQVYEFVQSCLMHESAEFALVVPGGDKYCEQEEHDKSLYDLRLVPTVVFNFSYENESKSLTDFLKEELMLLIQSF